ncbi:MAG TPA: serine hydrolase domain-containing protein, partial [Chitinophagales bacterium]
MKEEGRVSEKAFPVVHTPLFDSLDKYFEFRHKYGHFNGTVLIAKGDKIYYHGSFGYENFKTHYTLSTQSSFQLASVSKTFTSTAVLYLVEKGLINLEDTLGVYFPNFPYRNVRVKDLL